MAAWVSPLCCAEMGWINVSAEWQEYVVVQSMRLECQVGSPSFAVYELCVLGHVSSHLCVSVSSHVTWCARHRCAAPLTLTYLLDFQLPVPAKFYLILSRATRALAQGGRKCIREQPSSRDLREQVCRCASHLPSDRTTLGHALHCVLHFPAGLSSSCPQ